MREHLSRLHHILATRFSEEELRTLCFEVDAPYEDLPAQGAANKARELIAYLDRRGRISELVEAVKRSRPDIPWGDFPEERPSETSGQVVLPGSQRVYHNLPQPDYGTFIGRQEELAQVHRILRPYPNSRHAVVTIDGIGGIGKSALALESAHRYLRDYDRLPEEERFDAIVWASAKAEVLTADGIAPRRQVMRTLDDIYTAIAVTLEREDITRARPEEQDELVTKALTRQRTLLIVDNLETVDDGRVNTFLRELPAPTKAIVTTRHRIDAAYSIRLIGMPKKDALNLVVQECKKKDVTLTDAEAEKLYRRTGGVPLAMVWSVAQMGYGYSVDSVLRRLGQPSSDIARFCFGRVMKCIEGEDAHKLLMALAIFAADASREAIGYVADLPVLDRDDGLATLERLSLVNRLGNRLSVLSLTKSFSVSELNAHPVLRRHYDHRAIGWFRELCKRFHDFMRIDADLFLAERLNTRQVLQLCLEYSEYDAGLDIALGLCNGLYGIGFIDESIQTAETGLELARQHSETEFIISFLDRLGSMLSWRDDFTRAEECLVEAERQSRANGNISLFDLLDHLGALSMRQGLYAKAEDFFSEAYDFAVENDNPSWTARSLYLLGVLFYRSGNSHQARVSLEQALRISDDIQFTRLSSWIKNYLGFVAISEKRYSEAESYLDDSLSVATGFDDKRRIARVREAQGRLELERGNPSLGFRILRKSIERFQALGMEQDVEKLQALFGRGLVATAVSVQPRDI